MISSGTYGKVYRVHDVRTGEPLAIKVITLTSENEILTRNEHQVLVETTTKGSQYIVQLLHSWRDDSRVYFVMVRPCQWTKR